MTRPWDWDQGGIAEALRDETDVIIAGDWHNMLTEASAAVTRAVDIRRGTKTLLQLGDFTIGRGKWSRGYLGSIDAHCRQLGIERILITAGNHDDWNRINSWPEMAAGVPRRVEPDKIVWVLPPAFRFTIGDRTFLSMPGAASVHKDRTAGVNFWPDHEVASAEIYAAATAGGFADVMLTHEAVDDATSATKVIAANPQRFTADRLAASAESRRMTTELWQAVGPRVLFHGHMHIKAASPQHAEHRVYALSVADQVGNTGVLNLESLDWAWAQGDKRG